MGCKCIPHGWFGMLLTVLTTCGWLSSFLENGCSYSSVIGDDVISILTAGVVTSNDTVPAPFVEVGFKAFRIPIYNAESESWQIDKSMPCFGFPEQFEIDSNWKMAKIFSFMALAMGGGASLYMWMGTCCILSRNSWRWVGIEIMLAFLFQMATFIWFRTDLCTMSGDGISVVSNSTLSENLSSIHKAQDVVDMITTPSCGLANGSKADIVATCLWFVAFVLICCYYPKPKVFDEGAGRDGLVVQNRGDDRSYTGPGSMTRSMASSSNGSINNNKDYTSSRTISSSSTDML